ncbi:hypothetical protein J1614_007023 [Plenodomus biglobosus]|nr:hypothetical protein J1614_007023 [Plenodomus biglobosus]
MKTKRYDSLDAARDIAGHTEDSEAHQRYDIVDVGDIDIQAYRFGQQSKSRVDIGKMFRQSVVATFVHNTDYKITLGDEV